MSISDLFANAVHEVKKGQFETSDENKLKLYAYYKIANNYSVKNESQPFALNAVAVAKWNARRTAESECSDPNDAMRKYIVLVTRLPMATSDLFAVAAHIVNKGQFETSDENKLKLYAYFKIANNHLLTNEARPFALNAVAVAKWNARRTAESECSDPNDAMRRYIVLVTRLLK